MVDFLFLWLIFDFVYQRKKEHNDGGLVLQMEKREKKMSDSKIIKILYTHATVTVYICTVIVASG